jgi:hypothetical protein
LDLPPIRPFRGAPDEDIQHFLDKLRLRFRLDVDGFRDEDNKVLYTLSLLEGQAWRLVQGVGMDGADRHGGPVGENLEDFETIAEFLMNAFGSLESRILAQGGEKARALAARKLSAVYQTSSVWQYLAEVDRWARRTGWTEAAIISEVKMGLELEIRGAISREMTRQPGLRLDFNAFRKRVLQLDETIREAREERRDDEMKARKWDATSRGSDQADDCTPDDTASAGEGRRGRHRAR